MARKIAVEIVGDSSSLEKAFGRSARSAKNFNGQIEKTGKTGKGKSLFGGLTKGASLLTGALGVGGLATATKAAFGEMQDAQKVSAQTAAVLRSTKGAANVTAGDIDKLATSLMNMSGVDDEAIKSGENLLLTFTDIRNETGKGNKIFDKATETMLDMSVALGQDTKQSAIQLGKALQDPVKGITSLRRVGVQFTDGQEKQIKAMVKSGDTMGAQKLILKELNREFGGSAKAAGDTLPGSLNKLRENLLNVGGAIAEGLSPQIKQIADDIVDWISKTKNQKQVINDFKSALETAKTVVKTVGDGLKILKGIFHGLSTVVGGNKNAIKLLIGMYAGFKILTIAGRVRTLAGTFGLVTRKERVAKTATENLTGSSGRLRGSLRRTGSIASSVAGTVGRGLRGAFNRARGAAVNVTGAINQRLRPALGNARKGAGKLRGGFRYLRGSMVGKAGLVAAAGFMAYEVTRSILKITGLDKQLYKLGGAFYDLAGNIGLVNDQMAQYQGKKVPTPKSINNLRLEAANLKSRGLSGFQAYQALVKRHPDVAKPDLAAAVRMAPQIHIGNVTVNATNPTLFTDQLIRHSRRRPRRR